MTAASPRLWTNVYIQFTLPEEDQRRFDAWLLERGTTIGLQFGEALRECLRQAGIDPDHLDRPEADIDVRDHHGHGS